MVLLEREPDAASELADGAVLFGGQSLEAHRKDQFRAFDGIDAQDLRIGDEQLTELIAIAYIRGDCRQKLLHLVGVGREIHAHVYGGHGVAHAEVGYGGDLRVGNDVESAVGIADGGFAESHCFDGSGQSGNANRVAHVELIFDKNEDPVQNILDDVLRGEADGNSGDSRGSKQGTEVNTDGIKELQSGNHANDGEPSGANNLRQRFDLRNPDRKS